MLADGCSSRVYSTKASAPLCQARVTASSEEVLALKLHKIWYTIRDAVIRPLEFLLDFICTSRFLLLSFRCVTNCFLVQSLLLSLFLM